MQTQQKWSNYDCLHHSVISALQNSGLKHPTHIQTEVFNSYRHYYDFLIASQTGSGKTLAFAAPILSELQHLKEQSKMDHLPHCVLVLVLTPTRQLASQIYQIFELSLHQLNKDKAPEHQIKVTTIIGGMSKQRQLRVLQQFRPQIVIGTPGRLHQLLGDEALNFKQLKYLVVDEADRMVQMGHFKEIDGILESIFDPDKKQHFEADLQDIVQDLDKKAASSNDFYMRQNGKKLKISFNINSIAADQLFQVPAGLFQIYDPHREVEETEEKHQVPKKKKISKKRQLLKQKRVEKPEGRDASFLDRLKRRIFFISATLTREFKGTKYFVKKVRTEQDWKKARQERKEKRKLKEKAQLRGGKGGRGGKEQQQKKVGNDEEEQYIPKLKALISRAKFSSKPKIIDLSSILFLPERLIQKVCFSEGDYQRLTLLITYLLDLPKDSKIIIFANTIKATKRIQFFVQAFGFKCVNLHSHMQQRQRLKKLQQFKTSPICNILIATDVAARGLDFTATHVVQCGVPINGDTYVHRAGRTARAGREGEAMLIVEKKQMKRWTEINEIIGESAQGRKVEKFRPLESQIQQISEKVKNFEWVRVNKEKQEDVRGKMIEQYEADQLGVGLEGEQPRRKYDLDKQEEDQVRHQVKKRVETIRKEGKQPLIPTQNSKWRKNKLVLTPDEIRKLL